MHCEGENMRNDGFCVTMKMTHMQRRCTTSLSFFFLISLIAPPQPEQDHEMGTQM